MGRGVAAAWAVPHADADDYYWEPSSPPYVTPRDSARRANVMREMFVPRPAWVLSGSMMGWGDSVADTCDAIVFLTLDAQLRMARLRARQDVRNQVGGADIEADAAFFRWAQQYDDPAFDGRSRARHEEWLAARSVPILRLDSSAPVNVLTSAVVAWEPAATV